MTIYNVDTGKTRYFLKKILDVKGTLIFLSQTGISFFDPCPVITVAYGSAYIFLMRQVRWSDIFISLRNFQFVVIQTMTIA